MFTQALNVDIATISKSAKGRVLFYDADGTCVLGLSELEQIQLQYDGGYIYVVQAGGGTGVFNQGNVPATPMAFNCSFYKFTVVGLTDIDGRPFTALEQPNYDQNTYKAKVREAYEYLVSNIFVGCCNTGTDGILWYADEASFPTTGIVETIYVDMATPALFMWDGAAYVAFGGGSGGGVASVTGNIVDNTDPLNPVVTQVQSDWAETDNTQPDYIANKPDLSALPYIPLAGTLSGNPVTGDIQINKLLFNLYQGSLSGDYAALRVTSSFMGLVAGIYAVIGGKLAGIAASDDAVNVLATSGTFQGIKYPSDHSANFTLFSLIDLRTMKSRIWTKAGTPTTSDDSTQGYVVGSLIWDTTNSILYRCTDNTATAAVWVNAIDVPTVFKSTTDSAAITGTTGATLIRAVLIPANTFAVGDIIRVRQRIRKTGANGVFTAGIYINTSAAFAGSSQLAVYTTTAITHLTLGMKRDFYIKSATVTEGMWSNVSLASDDIFTTQNVTNTNIDWTVDQYFVFTVNPNSAADSFIQSGYTIELI